MGRDRISAVLAKELRRFLGTTNYMRRFIPNYADIVKPLTSLVNSNNKAVNTEAARAAFQKLLVAVDNQLSLRHLRYDLPIVVYTDASLRGLGGILVNVGGGFTFSLFHGRREPLENHRAGGFWSGLLSPTLV